MMSEHGDTIRTALAMLDITGRPFWEIPEAEERIAAARAAIEALEQIELGKLTNPGWNAGTK